MSFLSGHRLDTRKTGVFVLLMQCSICCIENRKQQKGEVRQYLSITVQTTKWLYRKHILRAPHSTSLSGHRRILVTEQRQVR